MSISEGSGSVCAAGVAGTDILYEIKSYMTMTFSGVESNIDILCLCI